MFAQESLPLFSMSCWDVAGQNKQRFKAEWLTEVMLGCAGVKLEVTVCAAYIRFYQLLNGGWRRCIYRRVVVKVRASRERSCR